MQDEEGRWWSAMYRKFNSGWMKHYDFILWDIICVEIAYWLACLLRDGRGLFGEDEYRTVACVLIFIEILVGVSFPSYKNILKRGYLKELKAVIIHTSEVWAVLSILLYLLRIAPQFSRAVFLLGWALHIVFSYMVRNVWKKVLTIYFAENGNRSFVIVTTSEYATKTVDVIKKNNTYGLKITGLILLDRNCVGDYFSGIPAVAYKDDAEEYLLKNWVDEVFVNIPERQKLPTELIEICEMMGITVHLRIARIDELQSTKKIVQSMAGYTVITSTVNTLDTRQAILKRLMDICGGLAGSFIALLLFVFLAPIIFVKSPGPIFFAQMRIGKNGRIFKMYKFRSMYMDAEERKKELMEQNKIKDGMMFKMDNDPRIIKGIGPFIRNHSLDEFPQFFNVLKGDMSLVGTRPPTIDEWEKYSPRHRIRMAAKPGITGMWQISGRSDITDFEDVVKLDEEYIRTWNFGLDMRIIMKTVRSMFSGEGAA